MTSTYTGQHKVEILGRPAMRGARFKPAIPVSGHYDQPNVMCLMKMRF
jgi:hypothetical protein